VETPDPTRPARPRTPSALSGTAIGLGALFLFLSGRLVLAPFGVPGLGVGQWLFLALPVVAALLAGGFDLTESLALRVVDRRTLFGAGLVMFGALGVNSVVAWLQTFWLDVPVELIEALDTALRPSGPLELIGILAAVALTPAICEELVFRGVMLQSWRRWPAGLAIGVNALAFGMIHYVPGTAFRVLPAAVSGAFIGWAVWRTRSLWVGVWMHALNNGFLILAAASIPALDELSEAERIAATAGDAPHPLAVVVFVLLLVAGHRLMAPAFTPSDRTA